MAAKVINLRTARKLRERSAKRGKADANAARHGRSKAEKRSDEATVETLNAHLDQHKLDE